jgi:hypothetical protein
MPAPLTLAQLDTFLERVGPRFRVGWLDDDAVAPARPA